MSSPLDPRRWSLRLRLTAYFFGATTTLLCIVGWVLYDQLTHQLWEKDEATVRAALDTQRAVVIEMDRRGDMSLWQREWAEQGLQGRNLGFRLIGPDGRPASAEATLPALPLALIPDSAFPTPKARSSLKRYTMHHDGHASRYMLAATRIEVQPGRAWLLQAAFDVTESQDLIADFGQRMLAVVAGAVLAASALAAYLVHRGLRPLRVMSEAIANIDADRLDARVAQQAWPGDLLQLAQAFDGMLQRLQAAFEQLSRFSSDLAHEFRSPITNLVAAAGVMLSRERSAAEYQDTLAVVVEEGDRLARMVSAMLFLARADHAKQALHFESVALQAQLQQIAEAYGGVAEERGVILTVEGAQDDAITVQADAMLLRNALSNLVSNALQHTPAGGWVTLSAEPLGTGIEFTVADNGSGIAAEHLPHIFERFYRADAARSAGDRTGLGLAVVRSIAELHGGRVSVDSAPGRGSRFSLWLPDRS